MFGLFKSSKVCASEKSAYDFSFLSIEGEPMPLSDYKGKVLLVVNTASKCGFTKQYDDLENLYEAYKEQGLVVIGVPSNDFGAQEPGTEAEIKQFCAINFNVQFPLTEKAIVSGDEAHPFYKWAADQNVGGIVASKPRWNFHKYLINREGKLVDSFVSTTTPLDDSVQKAVKAALGN